MLLSPRVAGAILLSSLLLPACTPDPKADTASEGDTDTDTDTDAVGPCAGGSWGAITDPDAAIHVRVDGTAGGAGTTADPVDSLEAALALARADGGASTIALGPGTFTVGMDLAGDLGGGTSDDETRLQGCSAAETVLEAVEDDAPVLRVSGARGVVVEGLCTRGGTRNIQVWSGAEVTLRDLRVEEAREVGIIVNGNGTVAVLEDVEVHDTRAYTDGTYGYGISLQEGVVATVTGGGVWASTNVGVLVDDAAAVTLDGITVDGTGTGAEGHFGRGIQVQSDTLEVVVQDAVLTGNHDAGIFAMTALDITISGCTVADTAAGASAASDATTGDGVVLSRGDGNLDPAHFVASLVGNTVTGSARAGIVVDGVTASLDGNVLSDNGFTSEGTSAVAQGPGSVTGSDSVASLAEADALDLNLEPVADVTFTGR